MSAEAREASMHARGMALMYIDFEMKSKYFGIFPNQRSRWYAHLSRKHVEFSEKLTTCEDAQSCQEQLAEFDRFSEDLARMARDGVIGTPP